MTKHSEYIAAIKQLAKDWSTAWQGNDMEALLVFVEDRSLDGNSDLRQTVG